MGNVYDIELREESHNMTPHTKKRIINILDLPKWQNN